MSKLLGHASAFQHNANVDITPTLEILWVERIRRKNTTPFKNEQTVEFVNLSILGHCES